MASEGGGKIKSKRTQHSSKPYERRTSLLGKLKSSVKDLFVPSWLSWGNEQEKPEDENQEEQEQSGLPVQGASANEIHSAQINSSQMKQNSTPPGFSRQAGVESFPARDTGSTSHMRSSLEDGPAPNVTVTTSETGNVFRGKAMTGSGGSRQVSPKKLDKSQGASRLSSSNNSNQLMEQTPIRPITVSTASFNRSASNSESGKQKLWSPEYGRRGKPLVPPAKEKPAFNSLLFGNLSKNETSPFGEIFGESSFYAGKTRYGGASAERKRPLNQSLPYQSSLPLRKQVKANKHNASFQATTSATAQRILETLDKMSTPLGDAKKIPQADASNDSILSFTPSSYRRSSLLGSKTRSATRPLQLPSKGPPTNQYHSASLAVIAKNRYRPSVGESSTLSSRAEETHPSLPLSQESTSVLPSDVQSRVSQPGAQSSGGTGKMKSKKFSQHISNNPSVDDEVVEVPNLRTDFTLPISNLTSIPLQTVKPPVKSHTVAYTSIPSSFPSEASPLKFTFSTPIQEKRRPVSSHQGLSPDPDFTFSSPIQASSAKTSAAGAEEGSKSSPEPAVGASSIVGLGTSAAFSPLPVPAWGPTAPKPKMVSPDIGGTSSSFKSYSKWSNKNNDSSAASDVLPGTMLSLAPAASLKTGSVMDILGKTTSSPPQSSSAPKSTELFGKKESTPVSQNSTPTSAAVSGTDDLMAKFKKPPGTWECDACMLANKPEATKCIACETPKPGSKPPAPASVASDKPPLSALFKKPSGAWECDTCMVQNTGAAVKCVACETPKPGAKQATSAATTSDKPSLSALFKKPAGNWECDTCMVQNSSTSVRCIACESPKPGLEAAGIVAKPAAPAPESTLKISPTGGFTIDLPSTTTTTTGSGGFKFGTDTNTSSSSQAPQGGFKFDSSVSDTKTTSSSAPSGGFQFGSSKTDTSTSSASSEGFKFGAPSDASAKPAMAGGFNFGASAEASGGASSTGGFKFGVSDNVNGETSVGPAPSGGFQFGSTSSQDKSKTANSVGFGNPAVPNMFSQTSLPAAASSNSSSASDTFPAAQKSLFGTATQSFTGFSAPLPVKDSQQDQIKQSSVQSVLSSSQNSSIAASSVLSSTAANLFSVSAPTVKSDTNAAPSATSAPGLFAFGAPVQGHTASSPSTGLGMGSSLASGSSAATPVMNGGLSTPEFSLSKDVAKPISGFGGVAPVFGSFGSSAAQNGPSALQSSSNKRSVDFQELGAPSAKKAFGAESNTNGPFAFGGSAPSGTGAPVFGSGQPSSAANFTFGQAPAANASGSSAAPAFGLGSGTSFGQPASGGTQSAAPGFNFGGMGNGPTKPGISFSATPNFNFGGTSQSAASGNLFQFGAKPAENPSAVPASGGLFQFGAPAPNPMMPAAPSATTSAFPAAAPGLGSFTVGASSDTGGRVIKRAVRRGQKK